MAGNAGSPWELEASVPYHKETGITNNQWAWNKTPKLR